MVGRSWYSAGGSPTRMESMESGSRSSGAPTREPRMGEVPGRSPSGVRIAGDDYQHLVTWNEVLLALRPGSDVTRITVEDREAGNVDDIVVEHSSGPTEYTQVKHAVDAATPV